MLEVVMLFDFNHPQYGMIVETVKQIVADRTVLFTDCDFFREYMIGFLDSIPGPLGSDTLISSHCNWIEVQNSEAI